MTPATISIVQKLQQLSAVTASDLAALGVVDRQTRKLRWHAVVGSISERTEKIRQHAHTGLVGEVLRTGSFMQFRTDNGLMRELDEAIMVTEKLCHAAAWPLAAQSEWYAYTILIGKRHAGRYEPEQIEAGTRLVQELTAESMFTNRDRI